MGFFHRPKRQTESQEEIMRTLSVDTGDWGQVFSACFGKMRAVQTACAQWVVKDQDWNLDLRRGVILFGNKAYPIQFIGNESASSNTWLWGWENVNGFSQKLLALPQQTKERGERWKLDPLTTAELDLNDSICGHNLSIVTCALADGYCYYRGPHAGGAAFVAFSGVPGQVFAPVDAPRFLSLVSQSIQGFPLDHRIFVESFLLWNQTKYEWDGLTLTAHFPAEVKIVFQQAGETLRIASLSGKEG